MQTVIKVKKNNRDIFFQALCSLLSHKSLLFPENQPAVMGNVFITDLIFVLCKIT